MKALTKKLAIIFILLSFVCNQVINKSSENLIRKISLPIPKANIGLDKYLVDTEQGGIIKHKTGTIINIPANAFVDKNGNLINGKVEIAYREMHSLSEIFVSGIPMTYDSAGTEYNFESAGMNEIKAFKDGVPVYINKDKTIDIAMKSKSSESKFNLYYYDTLQNKWLNKGKDIPVEIDESKFDEPLKPQIASNDKYCFSINVDYKEFPELKVFENTIFQLTDSNNIDPELSSTLWHDVKIEKGNRKGVYNISFACYEKKVEYEVTPVYDKNDFDKAIKIFEKKFESYKTLLFAEIEKEKKLEIERKRKAEKEIKELSKKYKKEEKEQKKQEMEQAANKIKMDNLLKKQANQQVIQQVNIQVNSTPYYPVYRTFGISQFGIYNSDCPMNLPEGATISATFVDPKGQPLHLYNYDVILLQPSDKKMFVYHKCSYANFKFNPDVTNIICTSTIDGKLAYFTAEDFKDVKRSGEYTFKMRISPREIKSSNDIDELLALK